MFLSLHAVLQDIPTLDVLRYYGPEHPMTYTDVNWMGTFAGDFQEKCIYIGNLSQFPAEIPQAEIALVVINDTNQDCSQLGIEVAEVAPDTELAELCLVLQQKLRPVDDLSEIAQVLLSGLFSNCSINEIIDTAFVHLNNPIMITFSQNHKNIFYSCGEEQQYEFNVSEDVLRERESAIGYTQMRRNLRQELNQLRPVIIDDGDFFKGERRVLTAITQGAASRTQLGVMAVFEVNRVITDKDLTLIRIICQLISEKCGSPLFRESLTNSSYDQRIQELIRGNWSESSMEWVSELFGKGPYDFSLAMVDVRAMNAYHIESLRYILSRTVRTNITLTRGSYLISITDLANRTPTRYTHQLQEIAKSDRIVIACSSRFSDIRNLKKYYTQAKMILHYAQRFNLTDQLCEFSSLRARILVNEIAEKSDLDVFICNDLGRLRAFDAANSCEYYRTLMAWLHSGMNREIVREQLHIHRNTLAYRLERIEEILGLKLDEGCNLLNLYLSEIIHTQSTFVDKTHND